MRTCSSGVKRSFHGPQIRCGSGLGQVSRVGEGVVGALHGRRFKEESMLDAGRLNKRRAVHVWVVVLFMKHAHLVDQHAGREDTAVPQGGRGAVLGGHIC